MDTKGISFGISSDNDSLQKALIVIEGSLTIKDTSSKQSGIIECNTRDAVSYAGGGLVLDNVSIEGRNGVIVNNGGCTLRNSKIKSVSEEKTSSALNLVNCVNTQISNCVISADKGYALSVSGDSKKERIEKSEFFSNGTAIEIKRENYTQQFDNRTDWTINSLSDCTISSASEDESTAAMSVLNGGAVKNLKNV